MTEVKLPGFNKPRTLNINGDDVVIDPANLRFNDATLNQFFEHVSGYVDYYGQKLADAKHATLRAEQIHERLYIEKFKQYREEGKSEKTSELYAKAEPEVIRAKEIVVESKYKSDCLYSHLSALNHAREDAHNRGHFLRKEMDKLNMEVRTVAVAEVSGHRNGQRGGNYSKPHDPEMEDLFYAYTKNEGRDGT